MPEETAPVANDMPPSYEESKGLTEAMPEVKITETKIDMKGDKPDPQEGFQGLTKEELMKYATDPFWVRLRWALFLLFWAVWLAMLVASVVIIVYAPKCPSPEPKEWWQKSPIYKVNLDTFPKKDEQDSPLVNLEKALDYTVEQGFGTIYITTNSGSAFADLASDSTKYGTLKEWESLMVAVKARYQYVVVDYVDAVQDWLTNGVDGFIVRGSDVVLKLDEAKKLIDEETENSGSEKVLIGFASTSESKELFDTNIMDSVEGATPPANAVAMKELVENYIISAQPNWPGIPLKSAEYGDEYVDAITMAKMLLPATLMLNAGEELGLKEMDWDAVAEQEKINTDSHLNLFATLSNKLRHQDAVLFGEFNKNTSFVIDDNVFGLTRVKKGNPGYLLVSNLGSTNATLDLSGVQTVPASIRVMAMSSTIKRDPAEPRTFKSVEVPLQAMETKIFTFVPDFKKKDEEEKKEE